MGAFIFHPPLESLRRTGRSARWEIDSEALDLYLTFGYVPAPITIYQGVHKLPAASIATFEGNVRGAEILGFGSGADPIQRLISGSP